MDEDFILILRGLSIVYPPGILFSYPSFLKPFLGIYLIFVLKIGTFPERKYSRKK